MATVTDLISRALRRVGVIAEDETATSSQSNDALDSLNDLLSSWMDEGIPINNGDLALTDTFPVDVSERRAVFLNLSIELASDYGRSVDAVTFEHAEDLKKVLMVKYSQIDESSFDDSLLYSNRSAFDITTG